jgi:hypothetical protein
MMATATLGEEAVEVFEAVRFVDFFIRPTIPCYLIVKKRVPGANGSLPRLYNKLLARRARGTARGDAEKA